MTLDEAIDLVQRDIDHPGSVPREVFVKAEALLIEAAKEYKEARMGKWYPPGHKLPGETEE
jgi:hypothetical protein